MTGRTLAFNLARALALVGALMVVAALVWRAQERAQQHTPPAAVDTTTSAVGTEPSAPAVQHLPLFSGDMRNVGLFPVTSPSGAVNPSFLPSSKSLTLHPDSIGYFESISPDAANSLPSLPTGDGAQLPPKQ